MPPLEADGRAVVEASVGGSPGSPIAGGSAVEGEQEFIWALFPHGLIYTQAVARRVSGKKVGPTVRTVERMLRRIGFEYTDRSIRSAPTGAHRRVSLVKGARKGGHRGRRGGLSRPWAIVGVENGRFRAVGTRVIPDADDTIGVPGPARSALEVEPGQTVWMVAP